MKNEWRRNGMKYELSVRVGNPKTPGEMPLDRAETEYPAGILDAIQKAVAMYNNDMIAGWSPDQVRTYAIDGRRIVVQGREIIKPYVSRALK
ncbi:MAG: hypothetical protein HY365_03315 [Candidatus Aenigmarchaeota archaeon]|nr:hypothetical protein [Candidatus Aenigmarchaeota archaeon]